MEKYGKFRGNIIMLAVSAFCYVMIHFAFDFGDFLLFKGNIGPKNFLPITMGMISGPFGAAGVLIGAVGVGVLSGSGVSAVISETTGVLIMSGGGWLLWYAGKSAHGIALKTARDFLRFMTISLFLSGVCAAAAFLSGAAPLPVFSSYMAWNMLLGIPVIALMTSIFYVNAVYPPWRSPQWDINEQFVLEPGCIAVISEKIDELCFAQKIDRKRGYQLQSCIEECILLILSEPTCRGLWLTVRISDSISIMMEYDGKPYNLLRARAQEDLIGLILIKQRALRVRYHYSGGFNRLHIVQ
jgi:hypothetical protein